jgi:hypothetical protein
VTTPDEESLMTIKRSLLIAEKWVFREHPQRSSAGLLPGWVPFEQFDEMVSDALKTANLKGPMPLINRRGK